MNLRQTSQNLQVFFSRFYSLIRSKLGLFFQYLEQKLLKHPFLTLLTILLIVLSIIILGNTFRSPEISEPGMEVLSRDVTTFKIGELPRVNTSALVEKAGVIKIISQTSGVVSQIAVQPGQSVKQGQKLVSLASNYGGGSVASVQRRLSQVQYQNAVDTQDQQKQVIDLQKQVANQQADNSEELRKISEQSINSTQDLINLNNTITNTLDTTIKNSTNSAEILASQQLLSSYSSANNQLKSQLRQLEYSTNTENPATELANLQKEITLNQLELQEKAVALNLEVIGLQLKLARIQEATMYPVAPCSGVVERVYINPSQVVNPGSALITLNCQSQSTQLVVKTAGQVAKQLSSLEPSLVKIGEKDLEIFPAYIPSEPTDGQLFAVIYTLPDDLGKELQAGSSLPISLPLGAQQSSAVLPFIPLEAVHQNELQTTVYVVEDGRSVSKVVNLGSVQGSYVLVTAGLNGDEEIIVDRQVVDGELVE